MYTGKLINELLSIVDRVRKSSELSLLENMGGRTLNVDGERECIAVNEGDDQSLNSSRSRFV